MAPRFDSLDASSPGGAPSPSAAPGAGAPTPHGLGRAPLSAAIEDYLKTIYTLGEMAESSAPTPVSTQAIADWMGVAPPSATAMIKKLAGLGLVTHEPYRGVELSEGGRLIALEIVRHHRLIETFLSQVLGLGWDQVHDEADRLEHVISEELESRIAAALGHPSHDPHGAPIPGVDGSLPTGELDQPLSALIPGQRGIVTRVADEDPADLRRLAQAGVRPGVEVTLLDTAGVEITASIEITDSGGLAGGDLEVSHSPAPSCEVDESAPALPARGCRPGDPGDEGSTTLVVRSTHGTTQLGATLAARVRVRPCPS